MITVLAEVEIPCYRITIFRTLAIISTVWLPGFQCGHLQTKKNGLAPRNLHIDKKKRTFRNGKKKTLHVLGEKLQRGRKKLNLKLRIMKNKSLLMIIAILIIAMSSVAQVGDKDDGNFFDG